MFLRLFFCKQKTADEMRISDWSSDVCSSDLLKEKLLAAVRGQLKSVLIPRGNVKDLAEIPENVKRGLEIVPVGTLDEVLENALTEPEIGRASCRERVCQYV